jgi:hypothetical protein
VEYWSLSSCFININNFGEPIFKVLKFLHQIFLGQIKEGGGGEIRDIEDDGILIGS